jgi:antagonist of KipI
MLEIIDPGSLATIQDLGRPDAAALGVPRAGACDSLGLAAANLLLRSELGLPAVELTGGLPALHAVEDTVVAMVGADIGFRIDGGGPWIRAGTSVFLRAGASMLATAAPTAGLRTYLALAGGIDVPRVLGSGSTSLAAGFGGLDGRPLRAGDVIRAVDVERRAGAGHAWPGPGPASGVERAAGAITLAVTDGPHTAELARASEAILAGTWQVADSADRTGIRLAPLDGGSPMPTTHEHPVDSFGLAWGAIEVPPDGAPIILLPDGPTVGGYPVPLVVATVDLPRLGQLRPGDRVRFRRLELPQAREAHLAAETALREARDALAVMRSVW